MKKQQQFSTEEIVVSVKNLKKAFGEKEVIRGLSFDLKRGENLVVLGKSGTGKSVTIKCIVGLIEPDEGEIKVFDQEVVGSSSKQLHEVRKKIGFLFQSGALYDSMTVKENMEFPLKRMDKKISREECNSRIEETLSNVGLLDAMNKYPSELSGGMRKRAGLARTLVQRPDIILYDEPTTGLDSITSKEISDLINELKEKYKVSSIIITHDMPCAQITSDRIIILSDGKLIAEGTYQQLNNTKDQFVSSFFHI